jgi:hypothetical protein
MPWYLSFACVEEGAAWPQISQADSAKQSLALSLHAEEGQGNTLP